MGARVGFKNIKAKFGRAHKKATDEMAKAALYYFRNTIFKEKAWNGKAWKPTQDRKTDILQDTGRMRKSIQIMDKRTGSIVIGTDVPYAGYHNAGTGKLPKRQFLGDSKNLRKKLLNVISETVSATVTNK